MHVHVCVDVFVRVCVCVWAADCVRAWVEVGCVCVCVSVLVRNFKVRVVRACGRVGACESEKKKEYGVFVGAAYSQHSDTKRFDCCGICTRAEV